MEGTAELPLARQELPTSTSVSFWMTRTTANYDPVSRQVMRAACHARPELRPLLPYARQFFTAPLALTPGLV